MGNETRKLMLLEREISEQESYYAALGLFTHKKALLINGYITTLSTIKSTVWGGAIGPGFPLSYPTSAAIRTISSDNLNDTAAGTGARTVKVTGLLSTYIEATETIILNGLIAVNTINSYVAINSLEVLTFGSNLKSAGNIFAGYGTVTAGVPASKLEIIPLGLTLSHSAKYTVPLGYKASILTITKSTNIGKESTITLLQTQAPLTLPITKQHQIIQTHITSNLTPPIIIDEKLSFEFQSVGATASTSTAINIFLILEKWDF